MSTLAVVEEILRETRVPMSVRDIVERAGERLPTKSKTPDTVVARDLSMDIKKRGESSKFIRTAPGRYTMRELVVHVGEGVAQTAGAETNGVEVSHSPPQAESPAAPTSMISSAINGERAGTKPAQPPTDSAEERARVGHH
jgi:hypothetical protein